MRRIAIPLIFSILGFCLSSCDDPAPVSQAAAPPSTVPVLSPDALAVKSVRDQVGNIESTYGVTADAVMNFFNQVERGEIDASNRDSMNDAVRSNIQMGATILAQSEKMQVPTIRDPVVQSYIVQVISAHKAWAHDLQKRNAAVFSDNPNIARAEHFKAAAEADASQEAATLALAYRAVGLPFQ